MSATAATVKETVTTMKATLNTTASESSEVLRKCKACGRVLPISSFRVNSRCRGGYEPRCKECVSHHYPTTLKRSKATLSLTDLSDAILINEFRRRGYTGQLTQTKTIAI